MKVHILHDLETSTVMWSWRPNEGDNLNQEGWVRSIDIISCLSTGQRWGVNNKRLLNN